MNQFQDVAQLISKDLDIPFTDELQQIDIRERLHVYLTKVIQELIDRDMNRLMIALYRIDIAEEKVGLILEVEDPEKISSSLASLVIERELQKVETRRKYRS